MDIRKIEMIDEMVQFLRDTYNVDIMENSRSMPVVIPRAALFNVCRGYYSATTIGRYFGKNHATILHHYRNHDALMLLPQYQEAFFSLQTILEKHNEDAKGKRITLEKEVELLRTELKALRKKVIENEEVAKEA